MSLQYEGKSSWPELVGYSGESAAEIIKRENTYVDAILVPKGSYITMEFRWDRVWVLINKAGKVCQIPTIG
ncbi:hypothetical protein MKW92_032154 [Papaver armeniacum]|nr:hypothetical protein MKW92_032154 [Papaver armeniacum]